MAEQSSNWVPDGLALDGAIHDLANALGVVIGQLERLAEEMVGSVDAEQALRRALAGGELALDLVEDLRSAVGMAPTPAAPLTPDRQVRRFQPMIEAILGPGIGLELILSAPEAYVLLAPAQLERMLLNLLVNAREAIIGGGTVRIETRSLAPASGGATFELDVVDSGRGASDDLRRRIGPAPASLSERSPGGRGTGLAITRMIAESRGGGLTLPANQPEPGTRIRLHLPQVIPSTLPFP